MTSADIVLLATLITMPPQFDSHCGFAGRSPGWCGCLDGWRFSYKQQACVKIKRPRLAGERDDFNDRMRRDRAESFGRQLELDRAIDEQQRKQQQMDRRLKDIEERQNRYGPYNFDPRGDSYERTR